MQSLNLTAPNIFRETLCFLDIITCGPSNIYKRPLEKTKSNFMEKFTGLQRVKKSSFNILTAR